MFEHDPNPAARLLAARALAQLAWLATSRWDHYAAHAAARRFEAGRLAGRWRPEDLDLWQLCAVLDALRVFEPPDGIEQLASAILQWSRDLAGELQTPEARRDVSVSLDRVGDVARAQGKLGEAETLYREGLDVARTLAGELQTPSARRDVSVSLDRVGDVARAQGKLGEAETLYREGLDFALLYRKQQACPDADAVVAHFEAKLRAAPVL